LVNLVG